MSSDGSSWTKMRCCWFVGLVVLVGVTAALDDRQERSCTGGVCVPYYLCKDGVIVDNGEDVIDKRFAENECPEYQVCCKEKVQCTCVEFYECLDDNQNAVTKNDINLRFSEDQCSSGKVCCVNPRPQNNTIVVESSCKGKCVPFGQCPNRTRNSGALDLRAYDDCPSDQVCCDSFPDTSVQIPKVCDGKCVPFYQCPGGVPNSAGEHLINLRSDESVCPGDQICCREMQNATVKAPVTEPSGCSGTCVPFYLCPKGNPNTGGQNLLNLRGLDDCPNEQVCCEAPLTQIPTEPPSFCDGQCVPFYQCSAGSANTGGKDLLNLRSDDGACPGELVCCKNTQIVTATPPSSCKGTCVPFGQCLQGQQNTGGQGLLNLRYDDCPQNLVCCEAPQVTMDPPSFCDGQCVPFYQCPAGSANTGGKDLLNLRSDDGACPGDLVCCKKLSVPPSLVPAPTPSSCKGTCVAFGQCPQGQQNTGGQGLLNLRFDDCPQNLVCCEAPQVTMDPSSFCDGQCVPFYQCPAGSANTGGKDLLNLRSDDGACPGDLVCCKKLPVPPSPVPAPPQSSCKGTCVPFGQCPQGQRNTGGQGLLNLRFDDCPQNLVCCEAPQVTIDPPSFCDGQCVPFYQCPAGSANTGGKDLLNLRSDDGACPGDLVCCKKLSVPPSPVPAPTPSSCKGTCVPFGKCPQGQQNTGGQGLLNLRYDDCPQNLVCCEAPQVTMDPSSFCDGQCVPFYQCPAGSANTGGKDLLNLRSDDGACPGDLVCCKKLSVPPSPVPAPTPSSCKGTCVPFGQCPQGQQNTGGQGLLNLRFDDCPQNLVCCEAPQVTMDPSSFCDGQCVPFYQCPAGSANTGGKDLLNLRSDDGACPGDLVCCKKLLVPPSPVPAPTPSSCKGTCVPFGQCPQGQRNTGGQGLLNLRFDDCPQNLVCCEAPQVAMEPPSFCDGQCVPFYQCPAGSANTGGKDLLNLRSDDGACPGDLVCCKKLPVPSSPVKAPPPSSCKGTCVPFYQCPQGQRNTGGQGLLNLRFDDCPKDLVCCEAPPPQIPTEPPSFCDGQCVPFYQCPAGSANSGGKDLLNLRSDDGACPGELVCCKSTQIETAPPPSSCKGSCVPFYQCPQGKQNTGGQGLLNLRSFDDCPSDMVCCETTPVPPSNEDPPSFCDGLCVPFYQCHGGTANTGGKDLLNLRSDDGACPGDLVCCKKSPVVPSPVPAPPPSSCKGTCVPFNQCTQGQRNTGGQGLLNLRFDDCPKDLVCCEAPLTQIPTEPPSFCDGQCVPFYQCPAGSANSGGKDLLNLRSDDGACPGDMVCCKKPLDVTSPPPPTTPVPPKICQAKCMPASQCKSSSNGVEDLLDLRISGDVCPKPLVCCETVFTNPPRATWMRIVNEINGMKEVESQPAKYQECSLQINFNEPFARQGEVSWLVTVWSKIQYLGQVRDDYHCVGTVIRSDFVLVPADCVSNIPVSQLYVRSGNYNLKATDGVSELKVDKVQLHPDYNFHNGYANIALLKLKSAVPSPSTACLANYNEPLIEQNCLLVGWSSLDLLRDGPAQPHKHRLNVQSCQSNLLCNVGNAQSFQNCASLHGSPLICSDQSGQRWKLAGLVTKGSSRCDSNAVPETLIKVNPLQPWINEQLSPSFTNIPAAPQPSRKYLPVF